MSSITVRFGSTGLAIWLGIGVLYHLITSDIPFAWSDPWLYVTMALWPFMLMGWIIVAFVIISIIWLVCTLYGEEVKKRQKARKVANLHRESEERRRRPTAPPKRP